MSIVFQNGSFWGSSYYRTNLIESNYSIWNNMIDRLPRSSASLTLPHFLALQKASHSDVSTIRPPDPDSITANMQSDEAKTLLASMNSAAGLQFLQNFYDMYMSPIDKCDITWRLGTVTGVKENVDGNGKVVKNEQVDEYGRLPTSVNFRQIFTAEAYSPYRYRSATVKVPYVNLFFPPYKRQLSGFTNDDGRPMSLFEYVLRAAATVKNGGYEEYLRNSEGKIMYGSDGRPLTVTKRVSMDMYNLLSTRGDFTYRNPAYKAVNDNITFLQWLFEQTSGLVSTYLTDWDLSLYIQEGLISNTLGKTPEYISLVHRLNIDNPSGFKDYRANSYGIVNAATSKLFKTNLEKWDPSAFPLSNYWCAYPDWEVYSATYSKIYKDVDGAMVRFPAFYWTAKTKTIPDGYGNYTNFYDKVQKWDEENAALAGWYNWSNMKTYQALYSTEEDGLSDIDIVLLDTATGFNKKMDVIDQMFMTSLGVDVSGGELAPNSDGSTALGIGDLPEAEPGTAEIQDGSSSDGSLTICGVKISGGLLSKIKKVIGIFTGASKKKKAAQNKCNAVQNGGKNWNVSFSSGSTSGSNGTGTSGDIRLSDGKVISNSSQTAAGDLASALGMDPQTADFANTNGVPQTNPPIYGGPHGQHFSPQTVQAYLQENNAFLRNMPRIDASYLKKDYQNETKNYYFNGVEKWYTKSTILKTKPELYEHSFSEGRMRQKHGISDYRWARGMALSRGTQWFVAETSGRGRCYRFPQWPTRINGCNIIWYDNGSYYRRFRSWAGWTDYRWYGPYVWWTVSVASLSSYGLGLRFTEGNRSYFAYVNNTSRWWWSGRKLYISTYSPYRLGYWYRYEIIPYKKYFLHSEPYAHWTITKIRTCDYHVHTNIRYGFWGWIRNFWDSWFGYFRTYTILANQHSEKYRLRFPDSWLSNLVFVYNDSPTPGKSGWKYFTRTYMEDVVRKNMVDIGRGQGSEASMIFLQGNSYWDRINNGPANIFRCKVKHEQVPFIYYTKHTHTKSCRRKYYHYMSQVGWEDIITVDLANCDLIYTQTNISLNSNYWMGNYPWKTPPTHSCRIKHPMDFLSESYRFRTAYVLGEDIDHSYTGLEGYGVLGCVQALDSANIIDVPPFENYSEYMTIKDSQRYTKAAINLNYKYYKIAKINSGSIWWNGMQCWAEGGYPSYYTYSMDYGLKKALARVFNRATLYKADQWPNILGKYQNFDYYYNIELVDSIRVLYSELLWQKSFLINERDVLTGTLPGTYNKIIDFDALHLIMAGNKANGSSGLISERTYQLSDPNDPLFDIGEDRKYRAHELYGYNPWIADIRKWVSGSHSSNIAKQNVLRNKFNTRINLYEEYIQDLMPLAHRSTATMSYYGYETFANVITGIDSSIINGSEIEEFMMGYLNILYEYRRFFINKRFNKQDGSMWLCRAFESAIPMVIQNALQKPIETVDKVTGRKQYPVAFYQVQNTNSMKLSALKNGLSLEEDRIAYVYVKIEYVKKSDYDQALLDFAKGETIEPTVVKVLPYYNISYSDFNQAYNSEKLRRTVINDGKPMVAGGGIGGNTTKYYQFDYTLDDNGWAVYRYKYAKKPQDGLYRLESKEFLTNESHIIYNQTISGTIDYQQKARKVDDRIDTAIWYISWGEPNTPNGILPEKDGSQKLDIKNKVYKENGVSEQFRYGTPGLYNLINGVDVMKVKDAAEKGLTDPISILCATQSTNDYWTVKVTCQLPRKFGFLSDVKLTPYSDNLGSQDPDIPTALAGASAYSLYPIMENQVDQIPNMTEAMGSVINNMSAVTNDKNYSRI